MNVHASLLFTDQRDLAALAMRVGPLLSRKVLHALCIFASEIMKAEMPLTRKATLEWTWGTPKSCVSWKISGVLDDRQCGSKDSRLLFTCQGAQPTTR
jgi:hypothetical protein